ncbi:cytochrome C [Lysobacter fragariae]
MTAPRTTLPLLLLTLGACQQAGNPPALAASAAAPDPAMSGSGEAADLMAQGEYLVRIGGCNDCHTPGYAQAAGNIPKEQWLAGNPLGWNGPWGTTYATNLRNRVQGMDEAAWLKFSGELHARPPMPDFTLRAMKERDRVAIYRFIRSLGPADGEAPAYLPPGQTPPSPYVQWVLPSPPASQPPPASKG